MSTNVNVSPIMSTYNRFPITLVKGKGSEVWDEKGQKYLDFTSGIATCNLGHVPECVKEKVEKQLQTLWHCSNLYHIPVQQQLANLLVANSFGDQVFFCNSGAEANEAAIKLARRYAQKVKGTDSYEVVTFTQSFHGRTLATLSATGQEKIQSGFYPLLTGFRYLPFNDMEALEGLISSKTCGVLLELVQGEGGVIPADSAWIKEIEAQCKKHDVLLMIDEIQTGMGRTGTLFAYEQYEIEPDVISVAKGLGSGFPIGAIIAKEKCAVAFDSGSHGSTFGGNPLAVTAGLATLEHMISSDVLKNATDLGGYLEKRLKDLQSRFPTIKSVRGKGLLQGVEVEQAISVVERVREHHILLLTAGLNVVRILPPLTTRKEEIDQLIDVLEVVFKQL